MNLANMNSIVLVSLVWVIFYFFHSLLASRKVKSFGARWLGSTGKYRLFYVIFSCISLFPVLYLLLTKGYYVVESNKYFRICSFLTTAYGLIILKRSFREISLRSFIGLANEQHQKLVVTGMHAYMKHPIYTGTLLIFIGAFLFSPTDVLLASFCCLLIYLPVGIGLEEHKLIKEYGNDYLEYKNHVKAAVIPKVL